MNSNNTTTAVLELNSREPEAIFFGQEPQQTDWDAVIKGIADVMPDDVVKLIQKHEPYQEGDAGDLWIWQQQQRLRLAIRHSRGLPLVTEETCPHCGTNKIAAKGHAFKEWCLSCHELGRQLASSREIRVRFDPKSKTWGFTYQENINRKKFRFWFVLGYRTMREAYLALYPFSLYEQWLVRKYKNLGGHSRLENLFSIEDIMTTSLPWTPGDFEKVAREKIRADMADEHSVTGSSITMFFWHRKREE